MFARGMLLRSFFIIISFPFPPFSQPYDSFLALASTAPLRLRLPLSLFFFLMAEKNQTIYPKGTGQEPSTEESFEDGILRR